ncbi:RNA 3'-terminal phosphate cyclase [Acidianus brierleyi]|uniref:RNA 3'-terminal phosphate cyclase n=1 Tax=Acidianus brierleyi TaxID=41673 RepID=A0A2U9IIL7_9CREN|nr:RNA 3'-terminal phosphate cyclase [Acidianus brierleyi]AWR95851.1 RNA 3'-terminal phosphate cyclase [Acidianus brierleyi]
MLEIDGSFGEGGGEILRTSLSLAVVTKTPFRIFNIRSKRSKPGLQRQHLAAVKIMKQLCNAETRGDFLGSQELEFTPKDTLDEGEITYDVGSAGSVTLISVSVIPVIINKKIRITLIGGTDVPKAPTIDYIRLVYMKILELIGIHGEVKVIKRGHYPRGGGIISIENFRGYPNKFNITEFGKLEKILGIAHVSSLPLNIAEREKDSAIKILSNISNNIDIELDIRDNESEGTGITLAAYGKSIIGADSLGEKGKRAEKVGEEAARTLITELNSGAAVDSHMSDMLMIYAALYGGIFSGAKLTKHAITNYEIIKKFIKNRSIEIEGNSPFIFKAL